MSLLEKIKCKQSTRECEIMLIFYNVVDLLKSLENSNAKFF